MLAAGAGRLSGARLCGGRLAGLDCRGGGAGLASRLLEWAPAPARLPRGRLLTAGSGRLVRTVCLRSGRLTDRPWFEGLAGLLTLRRGSADRTTRLPRDLFRTPGSRLLSRVTWSRSVRLRLTLPDDRLFGGTKAVSGVALCFQAPSRRPGLLASRVVRTAGLTFVLKSAPWDRLLPPFMILPRKPGRGLNAPGRPSLEPPEVLTKSLPPRSKLGTRCMGLAPWRRFGRQRSP